MNGSELDTKPRASKDIKLKRLKNLKALPKFGSLFEDYGEALEDPDYVSKFLRDLFTKFNYPDTFFIIAFDENEPVGFLWAEPVEEVESFLMIKEIFSEEVGTGTRLWEAVKDYAAEEGFSTVRGFIKKQRSEALERFFEAQIVGYLLEMRV